MSEVLQHPSDAPQDAISPGNGIPAKILPRVWGHDELAADLAGHLVAEGRMLWTDMQLGPAGSPRPDVYTIDKSFVSPFPSAYECKISTSDFRSDITSGKWTCYLRYAYRIFFAAPAGLISKADVPQQCGLILRHENAWRIAKKPVVNPVTIPQEALLKLIIDGVRREGPPMRAKAWHGNVDRFTKKFGATAARYVCDAVSIERELEQAEQQRLAIHEKARKEADDIRRKANEDAPARWSELLQILNLDPGATRWDVEREIRELRLAQEGTEEARELRLTVRTLRSLVHSLERFEKTTELKVSQRAPVTPETSTPEAIDQEHIPTGTA